MMGIEDENAALKQRVEELERERDEWQRRHTEAWGEMEILRIRAEQVEKERGAALAVLALKSESAEHFASQWHDAVAAHTAEKAARERAEADNAAMLVEMTNIALLLSGEPKVEMALRIAGLVTRTFRTHPGAALLEYVNAVEAVKDSAERAHVCGKAECAQCNDLGATLAAAAALKERKP